MKHSAILFLAFVLALLTACAASDAEQDSAVVPPARALTGTEWRLVDVGGQAAIPGNGTRLAFVAFEAEASSVRGHSGVNTFFGPYALDGQSLRIENLGMTRMAGSPELMAQESAFTGAIHAARSYRIVGDELQLLDGAGTTLARLVSKAD